MGFGFSSMPGAAQRFGMSQTPNAELLAAQAQQEAMQKGAPKPTPPQGSGAPPSDGMNVHASNPFGGQSFDPGGVNLPGGSGASFTPTPWTPGGVNLPGAYSAAADAASAAGGAGAAAGGASTGGNPAWMDLLAGVLGL